MKILIFFPYPKRGGIERNFVVWQKWLEDHELIVFTVPKDLQKRFLSGIPLFTLKYLFLLIRTKPDVVISFQFGVIALFAKCFGIRTLIRLSNDPSGANIEASCVRKVSEQLKRLSYRFADAILVNSEELGARVRTWNRDIHLVRNAVAEVVPSQVTERMSDADLGMKLLFVGRLSYQKNLFALIEGFHRFSFISPHSTLDIVGDGELLSELERAAEAGPGRSKIALAGWRDEIAYRNYDVFVLPSLYEGSPNALLEAVSSGLYPVITPFSSGGKEILEMLGYGTMARGFTPSAIADALAEVSRPSVDASRKGISRLAWEHGWAHNRARLLHCLQNV